MQDYPARLQVPNMKRGDTYQPIRMHNIIIGGEPAVITGVRSQLRTAQGMRLVHEFETDFTGNSIMLKAIHYDDTAQFPVGKCVMDIELTVEGLGRITIAEAELTITRDVTYGS